MKRQQAEIRETTMLVRTRRHYEIAKVYKCPAFTHKDPYRINQIFHLKHIMEEDPTQRVATLRCYIDVGTREIAVNPPIS